MQAQFILVSGQSVIANVEKVDISKDSTGRISKITWTNPPDVYAELRYIDPKQVVAFVMIHDVEQ